MTKFSKHKWVILTGLLLCPLLALAQATVPNVFTTGTVISSAQMNSNFTALATRLAAVEAALAAATIADIADPSVATNTAYTAALPVKLPVYKVFAGETGVNEQGASCKAGDILLGGGCNARDAAGSETCMVERNYPISPIAWYCRARKANGIHSECRATAFAVCLKAN